MGLARRGSRWPEAEGLALLGRGEGQGPAEPGESEVLGLGAVEDGLGDVGGEAGEREGPGEAAGSARRS